MADAKIQLVAYVLMMTTGTVTVLVPMYLCPLYVVGSEQYNPNTRRRRRRRTVAIQEYTERPCFVPHQIAQPTTIRNPNILQLKQRLLLLLLLLLTLRLQSHVVRNHLAFLWRTIHINRHPVIHTIPVAVILHLHTG